MPTIHGTPAGVSCILFSSPGSWDHREGDRQQSDSSSQEPSPQQQALKRRMWKSIQASDWKWACHHVQFWGPDNWSGTNLNHLLCNCLSVSNSAWKKVKQLRAVVGLDEDTQLVMKASSPEDKECSDAAGFTKTMETSLRIASTFVVFFIFAPLLQVLVQMCIRKTK